MDTFSERSSDKSLRELAHDLAERRSCFVITAFGEKDAGSRVVRTETDHDYEHALIQKVHRPLRLLIVGDGPDNAPLRLFGNLFGWEVSEMVDPNLLSINVDAWTDAIVK